MLGVSGGSFGRWSIEGEHGGSRGPFDPGAVGSCRQRHQHRLRTTSALNFNAFAGPIAVERFVAPGAPISGWAGVRVRF
jgi:hypothetical protein